MLSLQNAGLFTEVNAKPSLEPRSRSRHGSPGIAIQAGLERELRIFPILFAAPRAHHGQHSTEQGESSHSHAGIDFGSRMKLPIVIETRHGFFMIILRRSRKGAAGKRALGCGVCIRTHAQQKSCTEQGTLQQVLQNHSRGFSGGPPNPKISASSLTFLSARLAPVLREMLVFGTEYVIQCSVPMPNNCAANRTVALPGRQIPGCTTDSLIRARERRALTALQHVIAVKRTGDLRKLCRMTPSFSKHFQNSIDVKSNHY